MLLRLTMQHEKIFIETTYVRITDKEVIYYCQGEVNKKLLNNVKKIEVNGRDEVVNG